LEEVYLTSSVTKCWLKSRHPPAIQGSRRGARHKDPRGRLIAMISAGDYFSRPLAEFCHRREASRCGSPSITVKSCISWRKSPISGIASPGNPDMIAEAFAPQPHVIIAARQPAARAHISLKQCE
jgi:hypothetical protein